MIEALTHDLGKASQGRFGDHAEASAEKNSGALNSIFLSTLLSKNTSNVAAFLIRQDMTTLASTASIMVYHLNISSYRLAKDSLILSDNSTAFSSLNSLLDTILFSRASLSNFSLINLLAANDQSISETCSTPRFKSSGILITNSAISTTCNNVGNEYINKLFCFAKKGCPLNGFAQAFLNLKLDVVQVHTLFLFFTKKKTCAKRKMPLWEKKSMVRIHGGAENGKRKPKNEKKRLWRNFSLWRDRAPRRGAMI